VQGPAAFFREPPPGPSPHTSCDPTPYPTAAACEASNNTCVLRCCSQGRHVLDCVTRFPCLSWTAGAPLNPIQAQGSQCFWSDHWPTSAQWVNDGTTLWTVQPRAYHFTSNTSAAMLSMEQWTSVHPAGFVNLTYRMTFQGDFPWGTTTQEMPAIFTGAGINGIFE
jgi:hypothetical protein